MLRSYFAHWRNLSHDRTGPPNAGETSVSTHREPRRQHVLSNRRKAVSRVSPDVRHKPGSSMGVLLGSGDRSSWDVSSDRTDEPGDSDSGNGSSNVRGSITGSGDPTLDGITSSCSRMTVSDRDVSQFLSRLRRRVQVDVKDQDQEEVTAGVEALSSGDAIRKTPPGDCVSTECADCDGRRSSPAGRTVDCDSNSPLYPAPVLSYPLMATNTITSSVTSADDGAASGSVSTVSAAAKTKHPHLTEYLASRSRRKVGVAAAGVRSSNGCLAPAAAGVAPTAAGDWQQQMEQRADERRRRQEELQRRRQLRADHQLQEQRRQQVEDQRSQQLQKRERVRELLTRRRKEEERRMRRVCLMRQFEVKQQRAARFYELLLLRRGLAALRLQVQRRRQLEANADQMARRSLLRVALRRWRHHGRVAAEEMLTAARLWHQHRVIRLAIRHWTAYVDQQRSKIQSAADLYSLHLTQWTFRGWRALLTLRHAEQRRKLSQAEQLSNRLACRRLIRRWRRLPQALLREKQIEARKNRLRKIVRDIIPDFIPPKRAEQSA